MNSKYLNIWLVDSREALDLGFPSVNPSMKEIRTTFISSPSTSMGCPKMPLGGGTRARVTSNAIDLWPSKTGQCVKRVESKNLGMYKSPGFKVSSYQEYARHGFIYVD